MFPVRPVIGSPENRNRQALADAPGSSQPPSMVAMAERLVLDRLGPAYVIVSQERDVLYTGGGISRFLNVPKGTATHDLLAMIKPELRIDVRAVLHRSVANGEEATRDNILVREGSRRSQVRIACAPIGPRGDQQAFVLVFHDCGEFEPSDAASSEKD